MTVMGTSGISDLLNSAFTVASKLPEDDKQVISSLLIKISDIFERERAARLKAEHESQENAKQATRDPLTGCFNRRYFDQEITKALEAVKRYPDRHVAVIMLDMDHLKRVNDVLGHGVGDSVIIQTAEILQKNFRKTDILSRIGGDEFVMLLSYGGNEKFSADTVARKITENMNALVLWDGDEPIPVGVSIGAVHVTHDDLTDADLQVQIKRFTDLADERMYAHKQDRTQRLTERYEILKMLPPSISGTDRNAHIPK